MFALYSNTIYIHIYIYNYIYIHIYTHVSCSILYTDFLDEHMIEGSNTEVMLRIHHQPKPPGVLQHIYIYRYIYIHIQKILYIYTCISIYMCKHKL
jgi:hypothetical protein